MNTSRSTRTITLVAAAVAALSLAACSRNDDRTVGQQIDTAIAKTEQKAEEAKVATERATDKVTEKVENAAEKVSAGVADAAVTASINAELARDPALSALKIDVDTTNGRVMLSGKAPDAAARERATALAAAVKGVTSVDNRLQIGS